MPSDTFFVDQFEEQVQTWKTDHDSAMKCRDLEDRLRRGIAIFFYIRLADESWSQKVQSGAEKPDAAIVKKLHTMYEWWIQPCDRLLRKVEKTERDFAVDGATMFRECYREAKRLLLIDADALIESAKQVAAGQFADISEGDWGRGKAD